MAIILADITTNYGFLVSIGSIMMLLLITAFLIAFNTSQRKKFQYHQNLLKLKEEQQNELIKAAVRSEEIERHRISEELHDEVGSLLAASRLYLFNLKPGNLKKEENEIFQKAMELLGESIKKVRSISHNLHSGILREIGLNEAVQNFARQLHQPGKFEVITKLDEKYHSGNIETDMNIYRIFQELCGNIIKHSRATFLATTSRLENAHLIFDVEHDGNGLTQEDFERLRYEGAGLGLKNIQNRIILLNGKIRFEKNDNGNNTVILTVPVG